MLNADHSFNRSAIMADAVARARREMTRGFASSWQDAMSYGLKMAWQDAKSQRTYARWQIEQAAKAAALAALSEREQEIARVENLIAGASMIDNTRRMVATVSTLQARLSELCA